MKSREQIFEILNCKSSNRCLDSIVSCARTLLTESAAYKIEPSDRIASVSTSELRQIYNDRVRQLSKKGILVDGFIETVEQLNLAVGERVFLMIVKTDSWEITLLTDEDYTLCGCYITRNEPHSNGT